MAAGSARFTHVPLVATFATAILATTCSRTDLPPSSAAKTDTPVIPVGFDAFRMWDRWPYVRIGARAYMRSTADRAGGNEASDASHFIREVAPGNDVALDVAGKGVLHFFRTNHWHGSPWHFGVDGRDTIVSETSTATPDSPNPNSVFLPAPLFPPPLALTWSTTRGADLSWVPIPFEQSLTLGYGRTHYGTGYFIHSLYDDGADLSQPIRGWDAATPPPADVLAWVGRAGDDIAPSGSGVRVDAGTLDVPPSGAVTMLDLPGPAVVRALRLTVPVAAADALGRARLRVTWDGRAAPSIDAPVSLFYGTGSLFNRASAEYLVRSLPVVVHFTGGNVEFSTYFPMPFQRSAHVELVSTGEAVPGVAWHVRSVPYADAPNAVGYLHATYVDHGTPTPGQDLVLLDTTTAEGGGDFCGSFVGTSFIFSDAAVLTTLEGDPRFFFDDSQTPQAQGTGTEEWGGGGDYWGGRTMTLPFAGHPVGAPDAGSAMNDEDKIESAYRFLLADAFPFGKNARIQLEHGGVDESTEHYRTVSFWYGTPSACLVRTDALHVGDPADEAAHRYVSPDASPVETLTSRYELGVDRVGATEVYPATTDTGRHTTGTTELSLALRPDNLGVLLRRKLDYGFADQTAEVLVADDADGAPFVHAATWYLAGSNTCAFVNAPMETGVVAPTIEVSNRRWRDDELLLPRALTRGRSRIRVRIVHTPRSVPVAPMVPASPSAWSEYRYTAYSYVMPTAP